MTSDAILGFDHRWTCYGVETVTGKVITELPLVDVSAQVRLLTAGSFTAKLPLGQFEDRSDAQALLDATTPGKCSVVLDLDGQIVGEWVIWKRTSSIGDDSVGLSGLELVSLLDHRLMPGLSWTNTEQLDIASFLAKHGFVGLPLPGFEITAQMTFPPYVPSGVRRDRTYVVVDGSIGTRLRELSQVDNGFDYGVHTAWDAASSLLALVRSFVLVYPRAGVDQLFTFELGGNLASAGLDEDAVPLASRSYAVGATVNDVPLIGHVDDLTLTTQGYPLMDVCGSWTTVTDQSTIDGYAAALLKASQSSFLPVSATVFADRDPRFGEYSLGDRVLLVSPPTNVYPSGVRRNVRIVGWDLKPDITTPATIGLVVTAEG